MTVEKMTVEEEKKRIINSWMARGYTQESAEKFVAALVAVGVDLASIAFVHDSVVIEVHDTRKDLVKRAFDDLVLEGYAPSTTILVRRF